jgi:hypothetical protein
VLLIPALSRLRQEDHKFKADYVARSSNKQTNKELKTSNYFKM